MESVKLKEEPEATNAMSSKLKNQDIHNYQYRPTSGTDTFFAPFFCDFVHFYSFQDKIDDDFTHTLVLVMRYIGSS